MTPKAKHNISRIIPFAVIWFVFSVVYTLAEKGIMGGLKYYPSTGNPYNFIRNLFVTPLLAMVTGLLIGVAEILYFNKLFIQKSFSKKIFYKTVIYLAIIIFFLVIIGVITNAAELRTSAFDDRVWSNVKLFIFNYAFLSVAIYMASIIIVSQFYAEVSNNIGHGVLNNFFTGKYHKPLEEERIFMFLDMKSSTTIAEKLGHVKYFEMLKEYYADLSEPIIHYSGEVYQYVGDEIIVSWTLKKGLQNNNCIECFFAMKKAVIHQTKKYHSRFGLLPEFKAGFHFGKVTTGEIGEIKKEIIFTGDVLNTTSRIQGLCKTHKTDLLVSGSLLKILRLNENYKIQTFGENELRGRDEKIELFTIKD